MRLLRAALSGIGGINENGGNADGVRGFGRGTFSGVAGFGDSNDNLGRGVFGFGGGKGGTGIRGIAASGHNKYSPTGPKVGVTEFFSSNEKS